MLTTSFGRWGTAECSTRLWTRAKMAEFTPMASASVNTAIVVNPGALRSCRRANLKSWIMEACFSLEMQGIAGLDSTIVNLLKMSRCLDGQQDGMLRWAILRCEISILHLRRVYGDSLWRESAGCFAKSRRAHAGSDAADHARV